MKQIEDTDAVKRIMSASVVTFSPDEEILHAIHTMVDRSIVGAPVVDGRGNLVGVWRTGTSSTSCIAPPITTTGKARSPTT